MKVYSILDTNTNLVVFDKKFIPTKEMILMECERPSIDYVATADGTWKSKETFLDELKATKLAELKAERDTKEVQPIEYNNNTYDFDSKSRDRLDIALKALQLQDDTASIGWTMADNKTVNITANDILMVFVTAAQRSNQLHSKYRALKELVNAATTKEDLEKISFEVEKI